MSCPRTASAKVFQEARRLLRPNGYLAFMDMNPKSEVHAQNAPLHPDVTQEHRTLPGWTTFTF